MVESRIKEWIKSALIVLLAAGALLLGRETGLFGDLFNSIPIFGVFNGQRGGTVTAAPGGVTKEAARPSCIIVTGADGQRYGVKYDTDDLGRVYEKTSGVFGETLGSATGQAEITEDEWRGALLSGGVFFEYALPVRLSVMGGWFGASYGAGDTDMLTRRVCVVFGAEKNRLFFQDAESGSFFAAEATATGGNPPELGLYSDNGVMFAFETNIEEALSAPYMPIMPGETHPVIAALNPLSAPEARDLTLAALGVSGQVNTYYDRVGTFVSVGATFTASVDTLGRAVFSLSPDIDESDGAPALTEEEMIARVYAVAADTVGVYAGDASVYLEAVSDGGAGIYTVTLAYYAAGGRVYTFDDGFAAQAVFSGGVITKLTLCYRMYTVTEESAVLLPEKQALAAAGREFALTYYDTGADRLRPVWSYYSGTKQ